LIFSKYNIFLLCDVHPLPRENFAGGLLLSVLATTSSVLDHYLRRTNAGFAIGFTSVLIIVSARKVL
jgi:preprotein translocase subunit SecY